MTSQPEQQPSNVQGRPKLPNQILGGMSDLAIPSDGPDVIHLPECPTRVEYPDYGGIVIWDELACICPALRACEQRVLDAAREAVAELLAYASPMGPLVRVEAALAAIDALLGESNE